MASKKPDNPLDDGYETPGVDEAGLTRLRDVLKMKHWHFGPGPAGFDGFSEGICLLAGIDPEGSIDGRHFAPRFLPGAVEVYKVKGPISVENAGDYQEAIRERLNRLRGLRKQKLIGLVPVAEAIEAAIEYDLEPPWFKAANGSETCAYFIPAKLRTNDEVRQRLHSRAASKAGRSRKNTMVKTGILDTECREIFDEFHAAGFRDEFRTEKGDLVASRIAGAIENRLFESDQLSPDALPDKKAIAERVRIWLK